MSNRMPCAIGATYGQIYQWFEQQYGASYSQPELHRIHSKWKGLAAEVGVRRSRVPGEVLRSGGEDRKS